MGCIIELSNALAQLELSDKPTLQKIIVDMILRYNHDPFFNLAKTLDISEKQLQKIHRGTSYLDGKKSQDLAQQFLLFLGRTFFHRYTVIRNYGDES